MVAVFLLAILFTTLLETECLAVCHVSRELLTGLTSQNHLHLRYIIFVAFFILKYFSFLLQFFAKH